MCGEDGPEIVDDTPEDHQLEVLAAKHAEQQNMASEPKYFITVSCRASFRRLHLTGCFVKALQCDEVRYADEVNIEDFDSICRSCKKKTLDQCGKEAPAESSASTASSSSTEAEDTDLAI